MAGTPASLRMGTLFMPSPPQTISPVTAELTEATATKDAVVPRPQGTLLSVHLR